jgi:hypothetical protein
VDGIIFGSNDDMMSKKFSKDMKNEFEIVRDQNVLVNFECLHQI